MSAKRIHWNFNDFYGLPWSWLFIVCFYDDVSHRVERDDGDINSNTECERDPLKKIHDRWWETI